MSKRILTVLLPALVAAGVRVSGAASLLIPDATYHILLQGSPSITAHEPGTYTAGLSQVVVEAAPFVSIFATAPIGANYSASANVEYEFELQYMGAGTAASSVPILVRTVLDADADPQGGIGSATFLYDDTVYARAFCNYEFTCTTTHVDQTFSFSVTPGVPDTIELDVGANASANPGHSSAFGDPYITIDPSFADAASYTLVQSAGTGNIDPTLPEPASVFSMGLGAAGLAFAGYRKRRAARG